MSMNEVYLSQTIEELAARICGESFAIEAAQLQVSRARLAGHLIRAFFEYKKRNYETHATQD